MGRILKKGRSLIGLILIFSLIFTNMTVFAYGLSDSKQEIRVYFEKESGEQILPNEKGEFTLTSLDKGTFKLGDESNIKKPYWECKVPMKEGNKQWTDIWITAGGVYQGNTVRSVSAGVYDKDKMYKDARLLGKFSINNIKSDIEDLKLYVDGTPVDREKPAILQTKGNTAGKLIEVKAKVKGKEDLVEVPVTAYRIECEDRNNGWTQSNGYFGFRDQAAVDELAFKIIMKDDSAEASFKAVIEDVKAQDFIVNVPEVSYITDWNQLNGKQYIGITEDKSGENPDKCYSIKFFPEETSNQTVKWESLTPDIAEFQPLYGNGIVPKKAGTAQFKVTSESDPALSKDVAVTFKYRNPLKHMSIEKKSFKLSKYESIELPLKALPEDATEQRYNWSFDKKGIIKIEENVSRKNLHVMHTTTHTVEALEEGKVKVTGIPFDDTSGADIITFDVEVTGDSSLQKQDYPKIAKDGINHGTDSLKQKNNNAYNSEWQIFTLSRAGSVMSEDDIAGYKDSIVEKLESADDYWPATDYERVIIALTSLGVDAKDVYGYDLIDMLCNLDSMEKTTSNALIYALLALDTKPYQTYEDMQWNRNILIERLLSFQGENGGFKLTSGSGATDTDITAMAVQALAPYYKEKYDMEEVQRIEEENYEKVHTSVDKALKYLSEKMDSKAGYHGNSCTAAQVMTALTSLNIDPTNDKRFTKGNKNLVTNLMSFKKDKGFAVDDKSGIVNNFSNTQVTYALVAYLRMIEEEPSLYDMSDVSFDEEGEMENGNDTLDYNKLVLDMQNKLYPLVYSDLPGERKKVEKVRKEFDELYNQLNAKDESRSYAVQLKQREFILNGLEGIIAVTTCVNPDNYYEKEQKEIEAIWDEYVPKLRDIAEMGEEDETAAELVGRAVASLKQIKTKGMIDHFGEKEKDKVKRVEEQISKINLSLPTLKEDILQSRDQYQKLSYEDRKKVKNIDLLVEAEKNIVRNMIPAGYIYLTIEKSTLGQGYLMEPCKVPYYEGETLADVMKRTLNISKIEYDLGSYNQYYLAGIYENEQKKAVLPEYIEKYIEDNNESIRYERDGLRLGQKDYTDTSGWVFKVNDVHSRVGASDILLSDGMVIRWAYTLVGMGSDCWNTGYGESITPYILTKDELVKTIVDFNQRDDKQTLLQNVKIKEAYDRLIKSGTDNEVTQEQINERIATLNLLIKEEQNKVTGKEPDKETGEKTENNKIQKPDQQDKNEVSLEVIDQNTGKYDANKSEQKNKEIVKTGDTENLISEFMMLLFATGMLIVVRRKSVFRKNKVERA